MNLAHKIKLNPNKEQEEYFRKASGVARFTYNWALENWNLQYQLSESNSGQKPSAFSLKKMFNAIKREQFPFVLEVTKTAAEQAFSDLGAAFNRFFKGQSEHPVFKSKKNTKPSFYISNDQFKLDGKRIRVPKLGWVKMREELRFDGKIMSARISNDGSGWFVAIQVDVPIVEFDNGLEPVGIDLGVKMLMTLSDGSEFENQKFTVKCEKKLRMLNKKLSRQVKYSKNWYKTKSKISKLHKKIANSRKDYIHKATTLICKSYGFIGLENLNVAGMLKNHKLAKHIADASFGEIVRQFEYKSKIYGSKVVKISQWFPSTKTCSFCGTVHKMSLSDRIMNCDCGLIMNRDLNAAINIKNKALTLA